MMSDVALHAALLQIYVINVEAESFELFSNPSINRE